ncbi:MAG: hypothetical protein GX051_08630 [Clostridiales bacterium]|nr:hypothetical protein [Clostridiales bacterium]
MKAYGIRISNTAKGFLKGAADNWKLLVLASLFIAGMVFGAAAAKTSGSELIQKLTLTFINYTKLRITQGMFANFCNSFISVIVYLIAVFISGLCAVGLPFIGAVPLFRGLGLGLMCGYLYRAYELTGIGYCLLTIYPGAVLSVAALIYACNEGAIMSVDAFSSISGKKERTAESTIKLYCTRFAVLFAVTILSAAVDALFTKAFSGFFTF